MNMVFFLIIASIPFLGCVYDHGFVRFTFLPESMSWLKISTYGVMLALCFLASNVVLQKQFHRLGLDPRVADNVIIICIIVGIIGAKLFFTLETWNQWSGWSGFSVRMFSGAGLTWYGGFILVTLALLLLARKNNMHFLRLWDLCTPSLAIGYAVGRLGCIVSGDGCYGEKCPYDWPAPFAMSFPNGAYDWQNVVTRYGDPNVVVYNTPLFESMFSLLLFLFFWHFRRKEWPIGITFMLFLGSHSIFRFFIEFIRLNPRDVFGVTQAQFVSVILFLISIIFITVKLLREKKTAVV